MPPRKARQRRASSQVARHPGTLFTRVRRQLRRLHDPGDTAAGTALAFLLLIGEAVLCVLIIRKVPYTEIDWVAYMQEVKGYQQGERNYAKLEGDTGPLVYPAGFVYLFSALRSVTGEAVLRAQVIFAMLYLAMQGGVMALYIQTRALPPWTLLLLCLSRRLHSIFLLRLFNDCWAMATAYLATLALQSRRWAASVVLYSAAVSVKMNVLLMAPGVLAAIIKGGTPRELALGLAGGVSLQLILGAPFLFAHPSSYVGRAFEFTRVFLHTWTVNWKFLPEGIFVSPRLALLLLALHLRLLWAFAQHRWFRREGGVGPALAAFWRREWRPARRSTRSMRANSGAGLDPRMCLYLVFTSNFVGILCARSLHFQFYSWYFHSLPFLLLLKSKLPRPLGLLTLLLIEVVWNVFPSTPVTSACLLGLHLVVLWAAWSVQPALFLQEMRGYRRRGSRRR